MKWQSNFLFQPLKAQPLAPERRPQPLWLPSSLHALSRYVPQMSTVNCPVSTHIKVCVSLCCLLCSPRDIPALLSPTSLIFRQWASCTFLRRPFILIYKISCESAVLQIMGGLAPKHLLSVCLRQTHKNSLQVGCF